MEIKDNHSAFQKFIFSTPMLYIFAIGIWGSTWYLIKLQLGIVAPEMSIGYRFCIASLVLFAWSLMRRKNLSFSVEHHKIFILKGITLYSIGYFCAYHAGGMIPSGLNSILFSTMILFNIFNAALFFKKKISLLTLCGGCLGLGGLSLIFLPEIGHLDTGSHTVLLGMGLAILAGLIGSFGNIASMKSQVKGARIMEANAYSMGYGGLISLGVAVLGGHSFTFDTSFTYIWSLLYLAIFGSIITFGCYLTVLGRLGPDKAGYPMVLIPVVSLVISEIFEDYQCSLYTIIGIILLFFGNVLVTLTGKTKFFSQIFKKIRQKSQPPLGKNINLRP